MKPPKTIKVGPHPYRVITGNRAHRILGSDKLGETDVAAQELRVGPGQASTQERDSLLHEVLHACWDQTSLRAGAGGDRSDEEAAVSALAPLLLGVMRDNPDFVRWLCGD